MKTFKFLKSIFKNIILLVSVYLMSPGLSYAQTATQITFEKFLGDMYGEGNCVRQTFDKGYIVLATYTGDGSVITSSLNLIRTDSAGNVLWYKTLMFCYWGKSLEITSDGGFIVTGYRSPCNTSPIPFLLKTDSIGNKQWVQVYDSIIGGIGNDILQTNDGGYLLTGIAGSFAVNGEIFILKTDSIGNKLWLKKDRGILIAMGNSISKAEDENYIVLGTTTDSILGNGNKYMYLLKVDSIGNKLWGKTYDWNCNNTKGAVVRMDQQENYLLLGTNDSTWDAREIIFIKTDTNGNILWGENFEKYNRSFAMDLDITTDSGYVILGGYNNLIDNEDGIYLVKTNTTGAIQWENTFAHRGCYSMRQTFDKGFIITGIPYILLLKINDTGSVSAIIDFPQENKTSSINIYPNPVINDGFNVSFQINKSSLIQIKLYDYTGREVFFIRNQNQPTDIYKKYIPTNNLPQGLYFLTVSINEKVYSNKLIIF